MLHKSKFERCQLFLQEIDDLKKEINARIVNGESLQFVDELKRFYQGTEEQVRDKQVFCQEYQDLGQLRVDLLRRQDLLESIVYLNWELFQDLVELNYQDLLDEELFEDCVWLPVRDETDIIVPGQFMYSIDHDGGIWYTDLSIK